MPAGADAGPAPGAADRPPGIALTDGELRTVRAVFSACLPAARVWVFGSRATGRARRFSDLDLLVAAAQPLGWAQRAALRDAFEASELPFRVDLVDAGEVAPGMRERIDAEKLPLIGGIDASHATGP